MRTGTFHARTIAAAAAAAALVSSAPVAASDGPPVGRFVAAARYHVSGSVAEIADATPDGRTLVYTDSESEHVGFVDITDPAEPQEIGVVPVPGEPTSVAITPDGRYALVAVHGQPDVLMVLRLTDRSIAAILGLSGQPDSVAVSKDGRYAAIAIENERDEDVNGGEMPQPPPGFLAIVDLIGEPPAWPVRIVNLTGVAQRFGADPEPEFVSISDRNIAAVTLQENNHVALVDLAAGAIVGHWSAGQATHAADLDDDGTIRFDDVLTARREPDAIAWTPDGNLITANEGDYDLDLAEGEFVGTRDFTIFSADGEVLHEVGASLELAAAGAGLYVDSRSDAAGCEMEGAEVARFRNHTYAFIGAERCAFVAVYRLDGTDRPRLVQLLPTGSRPEGLVAIPSRGLFISANEGDGTIDIFQGVPGR